MTAYIVQGTYLDDSLIGNEKEVIKFVMNNSDKYKLGLYKPEGKDSKLEVEVSIVVDVPETESEKKEWKKQLSEEFYREKEIFIAEKIGETIVDTDIETFIDTFREVDYETGATLTYKDGGWYQDDLNWDNPDNGAIIMYDNEYELVKYEDLTKEQVFLLNDNNVNMKDNDLYISSDNKSGFSLNGNTLEDVFSNVDGRENELLVAIQIATPSTQKQFVDMTKMVSEFTEDIMINQQMLLAKDYDNNQRVIMYGALIDLSNQPTDDFKEHMDINTAKKKDTIFQPGLMQFG